MGKTLEQNSTSVVNGERTRVCQWIYQISDAYYPTRQDLSRAIFHASVKALDRLCDSKSFGLDLSNNNSESLQTLQKVGMVTVYMIMDHLHNTVLPSALDISKMYEVSGHPFSNEELLITQKKIEKTRWITNDTPNCYVSFQGCFDKFPNICYEDKQYNVRMMAVALLDQFVMKHSLVANNWKADKVAAAALAMARRLCFKSEQKKWNAEIVSSTGYNLEEDPEIKLFYNEMLDVAKEMLNEMNKQSTEQNSIV